MLEQFDRHGLVTECLERIRLMGDDAICYLRQSIDEENHHKGVLEAQVRQTRKELGIES